MQSAPRVAVLLVVLLTLAGCESEQADIAKGLDEDEVCERYLSSVDGSMQHAVSNGAVTSPPEAVQHRRIAQDVLEFARWAKAAEDPSLAASAERLEEHAQQALDELSPDTSDDEATQLTEALYQETTRLHARCVADAYRQVLEGEIPLDGACAEPGAPTLEGPNVVVYPRTIEFVESTCEYYPGTQLEDGCAWSGNEETAGTSEEGSTEHASIQVAVDHETCEALVESGNPRSGTLP